MKNKLKILFSAIAIFAFASVGHAASFDCTKASSLVEKAICSESKLSDLDDLLMQSYKKSMANTIDAEVLKTKQRAWLSNVRNKCKDSVCLMRVYNERLAALNSITASISSDTGSLLLVIKAVPQTTPDKGIKFRSPVEVIGKIEFGHDAAGGNFWINGGKKKQYTLGYVFDIDDATQSALGRIADAGTTVTVKGTLKVWKDGSASFDNTDSISIYIYK